MSIRKMKPKLSKNHKTFKKPRQAEFQITLAKTVFCTSTGKFHFVLVLVNFLSAGKEMQLLSIICFTKPEYPFSLIKIA